jgi:OB-fold nucleic acid binding domain
MLQLSCNEERCFFALMGYLTSEDERPKCFQYQLDDGTGQITIILWKSQKLSESGTEDERPFLAPSEADGGIEKRPSLGDLVKVNGKLSFYKNERQLTIHKISIISDPHEEALWHLKMLKKLHTRN